ncbi:hypothetical protein [Streptomyces griseoaurantiacus]|uniref:hypothetical protein n=1 Tax=Streptomyces griseoaurantiacus TaxID=68213 RepID=UPI0030E5D196
MSERDDLLAAHEKAQLELNRATLDLWVLRRRDRLGEQELDAETRETAKARIRGAEVEARRTERACRNAGVTLVRQAAIGRRTP